MGNKPAFIFELIERGRWYGVIAYQTDVKIGEIRIRRDEHLPRRNPDPHTPCYQVSYVEVPESMRRQGVATALYQAAAEVASAEGFSLCSDTAINLGPEAEGVWETFRKKRLAYWEVPGDIDENFDYGRYVIPKSPTRVSVKGKRA